ncbi:complement C1q-like protein 2 isoform X2 [Amia ocellicauda]|uniref:complement C1q-like protein 2 isoform X2 n=1 Tax=Amia ocellicauda TaxID=2972642 RepID=UPI0034645380
MSVGVQSDTIRNWLSHLEHLVTADPSDKHRLTQLQNHSKMLLMAHIVMIGVLFLSYGTETQADQSEELAQKVETLESELATIKMQLASALKNQTDSFNSNNAQQREQSCTLSSSKTGPPPVYFFVSYPADLKGKVDIIKFSNAFVNIGQAYNPATGIFACPVSGIYQVFFSSNFGRGTTTNLWLVKDGHKLIISHSDLPGHTVGNQVLTLLELQKGSHLWVTQDGGMTWSGPNYHAINFGGYLLYPLPDKQKP